MDKYIITMEWYMDDGLKGDDTYYKEAYLSVYNVAAEYMNKHLNDLNAQFIHEVGRMDDYDNPTYNNWMALHMTEKLIKSGKIKSDIFAYFLYDSNLVLNCYTRYGDGIRMEFVPGSDIRI